MHTHLKFILRNLARNKMYSGINIFGLAIGIAAALLIYRIVQYELSYNKNFNAYERIVRIVRYESGPEGDNWGTCVPIPAMAAIQEAVTQFEHFSRVREVWPTVTVPNPGGGPPIKKFAPGDSNLAFFVEPAFFKIFDLQWMAGDPETSVRDAGTAVLTKSFAEKCFDNWQNAMGQTVLLENLVPVVVRGIVEDLPDNCDFPLFMMISYPTLKANAELFFYEENWGSCSSNNQAFALLSDKSKWEAAAGVLSKVGEKEYAENSRYNNVKKEHRLQPLSDLHYNPNLGTSSGSRITKNRLRVLSFVGLLVLIMACFNFINLSTAMATQRAKEVGVRKTLGSSRKQLVGQFMAETATVTLAAAFIGVNMAALCLPLLRHISGVPPHAPFLSMPQTWIFIALTVVAVTVLAGFYPAIVLAGFDPAGALKNSMASGGRRSNGALVRQGLVVLQFSIAVALIIGALVALGQLDYIRKKDLGFNKDLVYTFYFNADSLSLSKLSVLKQRLLQIPAVERVSFSSDLPSSGNTWNTNFAFPASAEDAPFDLSLKFADEEYLHTYGLRLAAGNWYEASDTMRHAVVNQTFMKKLGIVDPAEVIGQELRLGSSRRLKITGVVEDFHTHSMHRPLEPLLIGTRKDFYYNAGVRIKPGELAAATRAIEKTFDAVYPEQVFAGAWFDENIARFYEAENRFVNTCKGFSLLAVLIACLGLFGLSSHAAARRAKEIGIRKVLGASAAGITGLLARDFIKLVLPAIVIASPFAWHLMNKWLADFAYRIEIGWWMFAAAGLSAMAVAALTVAVQSVRAALANPVESLRSE